MRDVDAPSQRRLRAAPITPNTIAMLPTVAEQTRVAPSVGPPLWPYNHALVDMSVHATETMPRVSGDTPEAIAAGQGSSFPAFFVRHLPNLSEFVVCRLKTGSTVREGPWGSVAGRSPT
jgi:hypothetical protein